jgi:predicted Zn finger-like uncharacterized protein
MILSCPACSTRYSVPDTAVGAKGRTVRCAACAHSWRVEAWHADGATFITNAPPPPPPPPAPEPPPPPKPPHRAYRAKVEQRKRNFRRTVAAGGWGAAAASLAVALGLGWAFRADIVRALPQTASAYALTGTEVNMYGLAIENMVSERVMEDGEPALAVRAELRNIDRRARRTPLVRFDLRDASGEAFFAWTVAPDAAELAPGQSLPVAAVLISPPDRAVDVVMTLTDTPAGPLAAPSGEGAGSGQDPAAPQLHGMQGGA